MLTGVYFVWVGDTILIVIVSFPGRQVAVDWAVPKDKFIATQQSSITGDRQHCKQQDSNDKQTHRL